MMTSLTEGPEDRGDGDGEQDGGEGHQGVVEAHQTVVEVAEIAGGGTDRGAQNGVDDDDGAPDVHGKLRAPDDSRPQGSAEIVGAEEEVPTGGAEFGPHGELVGIERGDPGGGDRDQKNDAEENGTQHEQAVVQQAA